MWDMSGKEILSDADKVMACKRRTFGVVVDSEVGEIKFKFNYPKSEVQQGFLNDLPRELMESIVKGDGEINMLALPEGVTIEDMVAFGEKMPIHCIMCEMIHPQLTLEQKSFILDGWDDIDKIALFEGITSAISGTHEQAAKNLKTTK